MRGVRVTAMAPATIANVGPGFDVFGLAVSQPVDIVTLETNDSGQVTIDSQLGGEVGRNSAGAAVLRLLEKHPLPEAGVRISLTKGMEVGTGMGSSAASCAAAAKAFSELHRLLTGTEVAEGELLEACVHAESVCAGSRHGDNCIPALLGGFVIVTSVQREPEYLRLEMPAGMRIVLIKPDISILTRAAREILPATVSLHAQVSVAGHCAAMAAAISRGDVAAFCSHLVDSDVERARATLIPNYDAAKQAALAAGALAFSIAGSGPSVFAVTTDERRNEREIADKVRAALQSHCKVFSVSPSNVGARVIHSEMIC